MTSTAAVPKKCTVLVVGGGPGGSYTASVLAREGIDTVVLEADTFPRYHIGESTLPSIRYYLRFIGLDNEFAQKGFTKKVGAAFNLSHHNREGYTNFLAEAGSDNYAWNVIRSEADDMMFRHAGKSGAKIFECVKVNSIDFVPSNGMSKGSTEINGKGSINGDIHHGSKVDPANPGRPVSASWTRKTDGSSGVITFDYLVDASGRTGLLSSKYLKNRRYNRALKNVANWAYFKGAGNYGEGSDRKGSPFFQALEDESGWTWFIPLHDGTTSVGVVQDQDVTTKRKAVAGSAQEYFDSALKLVPRTLNMLGDAKQVTPIKSASDYSYHASAYAFPYARMVGDAGAFIDPLFSSGIHLAMTGGLAAATSIAASIRGDCDEATAAKWHSNKIREGYARFFLAVLGAYKQMQNQNEAVWNEYNEDNFDRAFNFLKPVIQGTADATGKFTQAEFSKTVEFLSQEFFEKAKDPSAAGLNLSEEDAEILHTLPTHFSQDEYAMKNFTTDVIDGKLPRLEKGNLTLVDAAIPIAAQA